MNIDIEQLYNTYYMQVYSFVLTLAKNRGTAEEVTQKTFVKAMSAAKSFRGQASEFTWLCAIAKNLLTDEYRQQKREQPLEADAADGADSGFETALANQDEAFRVHQILHSTEEPYKEVFQLRVFGELPFRQIGNLFGKTENWARVTYHRARLKIQERMEKNEQ